MPNGPNPSTFLPIPSCLLGVLRGGDRELVGEG